VWSNADTTKIPLLVREGSIIPMLNKVPQTLCDANYVNNPSISTMDTGLQFLIYPGASVAAFNMYDGTTAQCTVTGTATRLELTSISRDIALKVYADSSPAGVERNGLRLPHQPTQNDFSNASLGWIYDATAKFLYVKFTHSGGNVTISFGPDSIGNGPTDSWRQYYGIIDDNADEDGDGLTNKQEYFTGTNPNDPQSTFKTSSVSFEPNVGFHVLWPSQAGIPYRVQWKNALPDATWQPISPDFTGNGSILDWLDDGSQTSGFGLQRFYRVAVP
jgi:hypothetical protein